jgi:uncharacterized protein with PQ loop repeat
MAIVDVAAIVFTATNLLRTLAYVPQIHCVWKDRQRADAVSVSSWGLFGISNVATTIYASLSLHDLLMAAIFTLNAICCLAIIAITCWKRRSSER